MPEITVLSNFPFDAVNSGISLGYKNEEYIADQILPRKTVGKQAFYWTKYAEADGFTIPNTFVGRRSGINEVTYSKSRQNDSCVAYGLKDKIPAEDESNQDPGDDVVGESVMFTTDLIELDREKRVSEKLTDLNLYPVGNKVSLVGADQWSDYSGTSSPIQDFKTARLSMRRPGNYGATSMEVAEALTSHPEIVAAINRNEGTKGDVTIDQVAKLLKLKKIFVADSWYNSAAEGQTEVFERVWGKDFLIFYKNPQSSFRRGVTFGLTAQWAVKNKKLGKTTRLAGKMPYTNEGLMGGTEVRVGEYVQETILCAACGYLIKDAIA